MISVVKLIAVLFQVITIVTSNPNIPQDTKDQVMSQITEAITSQNQASATAPVVSPTLSAVSTAAPVSPNLSASSNPFMASTAPQGNTVPAELPTSSAPTQVVLGTISIPGQPSADGSYPVTAQMNDASSVVVSMVNSKHGNNWKAQTGVNNEIFRLYDDGDWTYTVTSYDRAGKVMGETTGSFTVTK